jgi:hypothetical protein
MEYDYKVEENGGKEMKQEDAYALAQQIPIELQKFMPFPW